jgi:hypothetical protein
MFSLQRFPIDGANVGGVLLKISENFGPGIVGIPGSIVRLAQLRPQLYRESVRVSDIQSDRARDGRRNKTEDRKRADHDGQEYGDNPVVTEMFKREVENTLLMPTAAAAEPPAHLSRA